MSSACDTFKGLHIHPTRQCNLRCIHCYSSSAPEERDHLDPALLLGAITDASEQGYNLASFSGGEPLLYKPLGRLLDHARRCGMTTTVTSNGMLLDERRLEVLRGRVDVLAISLDGVPESHNRMRASGEAFEKMSSRLEGVRESGIPFGFIFTLTQYNLGELEWVANFALEQGARLLQIHPLEEAGRAGETMADSKPDELESAYTFLEVARIRTLVGDRMLIQLDLADRDLIREDPSSVFAGEPSPDYISRPLADLVSPLVIEADATVVPVGYWFARRYALGNLHSSTLSELAGAWRRDLYPAFRDLCSNVYRAVTAPADFPFTNWYEALAVAAESPPAR
ncbi:MAG TPA: radical SAM/SPASM domain-containing protein [Blastocatellia bacterium]|nr:radical SAM/SPASM domain-containing protein [Blastocatellia bacterium]